MSSLKIDCRECLLADFPSLRRLRDEIDRFCDSFRPAGLPEFHLGIPLDLYPERQPLERLSPILTWADQWPYHDYPGVYSLFDEQFDILYIGKASMGRCLGKRLYEYFGSAEICIPKHDWLLPVRYVVNTSCVKGFAFEAPALEEYLISRISPKLNGVGKTR
jgi:hypothetical protein